MRRAWRCVLANIRTTFTAYAVTCEMWNDMWTLSAKTVRWHSKQIKSMPPSRLREAWTRVWLCSRATHDTHVNEGHVENQRISDTRVDRWHCVFYGQMLQLRCRCNSVDASKHNLSSRIQRVMSENLSSLKIRPCRFGRIGRYNQTAIGGAFSGKQGNYPLIKKQSNIHITSIFEMYTLFIVIETWIHVDSTAPKEMRG